MTTYNLLSSRAVHAPGIVAWAINGYHFEIDRPQLLRVVTETWKVPEAAAKALLEGETPYKVEGEVVTFDYEEASP